MKKIVLILIAMMAAVMPMKADYTLNFVESTSTSDASTAYSMDVSKVFVDASDVVGEVKNVTSVYPAKKGYGAKFGSSKAAGNLKFTLLQSTYVAAILKVAAYTTTTSVTLSVNGMELPVEMPADGSPVEVTYSPGTSFETMEITTIGSTRFYLVSVTLVEQSATPEMGTTPSDCHVVSFPWEENFDISPADGGSVLPCWDNSVVSASGYNTPWSLGSGVGLRSQCMRFDSYNTSSGVVGDLRSPEFMLTSNLALYLKYKNPSGGDFSVYVVANGAEQLLASGLTNQTDWAFPSFDLSNYVGQQVYFVFRGTSNYGMGDAYIYLDRVAVMPVGSQMDTTNDPDFMPYISTNGQAELHVDVPVGGERTDFITFNASKLGSFPTVTSSIPTVLAVEEVQYWDANYNVVTNPGDIVNINVKYVASSQVLENYEGVLTVDAVNASLTLPITITTLPNYEIVPQDGTYEAEYKSRVLHLYTTPGQTVSHTLKYTYDGFTFDQIQAGFVQDWAPEGFSGSQAYQTGEGSGAFDLTATFSEEGDYMADVRYEGHAGLCGTDVYESLTVYVHVTNSPMITGATEWNWGTVDYLCADTNYLTLQLLNMDTTAQITMSTYPAYKFMLGDYSVSDGKLTIPAYLPSTLYAGTTEAELYVYLNGREVHKVSMKVDVREPRITYLTPRIEFGTMRASDYPVWDTVYISVHDVDRSQLNFGWNVLPQDTADHRMDPFGVAPRVIINDTLVACPVACNPAATVPGEYDGRIYYVCGMYWPEIPCHATILPSSKIEVSSDTIDFGVHTYSPTAGMVERLLTITTQSLQETTAQIGGDDAFALSSYTYKPAEGNYGLECRHQVTVFFEPHKVGEHNAILYLEGDTGRLEVRNRVYLHGSVVLPEPQFLPDTVIDFGTMNYYEEKTLGANVYMRYIDPKTTKMTSDDSYNMLTLGAPLRQYDTTNVNVMEYLPNYYPVTLKATRTGDIEHMLTLTSAEGAILTRIKVRAHVLEPEMFFDEQVHDFGVHENGGRSRNDTVVVHIRNFAASELTVTTSSSSLDASSESGFGTGKKIIYNDSTVGVVVGMNPNLFSSMGVHYRNFEAICHSYRDTLLLKTTIIPDANLTSTVSTLDLGSVPYHPTSKQRAEITFVSTSLKTINASVVDGNNWSIDSTEFVVSDSQLGQDVEHHIMVSFLPNTPGENNSTLLLSGKNGSTSLRIPLHAVVGAIPTSLDTISATICQGEVYEFGGQRLSETGVYDDSLKNVLGGDSIWRLTLTVLPTKTGEESVTIRDYEVYTYQGDTLRKAGDYTYTLVAANGCDSTVTLHLAVLATKYRTEEATICSNQSYTFYGDEYTEAGQYEHRIENTQLGDSVITLNLTVLPTKTGEESVTIRDYETYTYQGDTLRKAGDYTYTLVAANGCDSTVTLHLTVLATKYRTEDATICSNQSYTFYGDEYTEAGQYEHRIENTQLGDSVITLNLTVLPTKTGEESVTIRDYEVYTYQGDSLSKAGDYTYTLVAANGCDSTVTLHLTVLATKYRTEEATICSNQSYTFYGDEYTKAGKYEHRIENTQLGDSVITLNLTVLPTKTGEESVTIRDYEWYHFPAGSGRDSTNVAGDYTYTLVAANGCDSTVTLHLTVLATKYRTEDATICSNQSYTFYGDEYTEAGQYEHRIENTQLGDSVITLNLTVLPTKTGEESVTIRDYETYTYQGDTLRKAGDYTYTLVAANGCDSTVTLHLTVLATKYRTEDATICSNQSYTFYGDEYTKAGQYEHRIENTQLGDSVITLNLTVLPTKTGEESVTIRDYEWYHFPAGSGRDSTNVAGDYTYTLVAANGCDSTVTLTLNVIPSCSEYVVVNAPKEVVYYSDEAVPAPVVELTCSSRDAVIEWGAVRNYNPSADGKVDVTNPVEYELMQVTSMNEYQGDTLSSRFNNYVLDRTQYFYYLIWQCDSVKEMQLFHFEHNGQVNSIWVNYAAPKRDQLIASDATVSVDGGKPKAVTVAWYNTQDAANVATGNFEHGETYYAVVTTPMTEFLGENYHIDATTAIVWGEEQQPKELVDDQLQSPMYTMENVTWTFRLEDAQLAPDGQASIRACAEPSVSISGSSSVVLNWELSTDNLNWLTLSDTLGYNIVFDSYCTDIHFPATLLRAGTYYIRVRAQYGNDVFFSRTAELVIQAGIVMAEEATQQTTVTETGEEVATVQYMFDEEEEVGVLTLTNSTNEGSATTAVAITTNTVVEIVGANTVVSDEAGFESSGDLEFVGRIDSTQVDEEGNTVYQALDSMSIVSQRPLYAPGQGVKVTFNGVYMVLIVHGHEDDNLIPSRSAARAQTKRAYRIAHAALETAGDESVISGFDEVDFINCGVIEPEGADYNAAETELMADGDPVYNCTIAPVMSSEEEEMAISGALSDVKIRAEKRLIDDIIYIIRQNKTYTVMGQSVE